MHRSHAIAGTLVAFLLIAFVLAACSGVQPTQSIPSIDPSSDVRNSPTAQATPMASPVASSTSPAPEPSALTQEVIGAIDVGAFPNGALWGILGFDAGYVGWGTYGIDAESDAFTIWHSADGVTWAQSLQAERIAPCPDWTPRSNMEFFGGASSGRQIVLVGSVLDSPTRTACDEAQPASLVTDDGINWHRSEPSFDGPVGGVWATDGGWMSAESSGTIWRSADGLAWTQAGAIEPEQGHYVRIAGDRSGTLLAARASELLVSADGYDWEPVYHASDGFVVTQIAPPANAGDSWIVAVNDYEGERGQLLSSADLRSWQATDTPNPETAWILRAHEGWLALTIWVFHVTGCQDCPNPPAPVLLWSADGVTWSTLQQPDYAFEPMGADYLPAVGPAGILLPRGFSSEGALISRLEIR
jgi:hypothetical protein